MTRETQQEIDRRNFLRLLAGSAAVAGTGPSLASCARRPTGTGKKVVVLGLDGLDPQLLQGLIDAGRAPNFKKLLGMGSFHRLGTTMPALSPVAWSSFITGLTPGGHGIGDFIMRDPETYLPVFSIYGADPPSRVVSLGCYELPLGGGDTHSGRRGRPFWSWLTESGIPAVVVKIPTNYPLDETATRAVGGMGTPDLADAYGLFNYYTSDPFEDYPDVSGGYVHYVDVLDGYVGAELVGPQNSFAVHCEKDRRPYADFARTPLEVHIDGESDVVRIDVSGRTVLLREGEWSEWVPVDFELIPVVGTANGMCRFLLKSVRPHLQLYVSPINIDPSAQATPVTWPEEYGAELADAIGPFYTKGLPADTKAFDHGVFSDENYVSQAESILAERLALFEHEWERFEEGLFYFYVSSTDQDAHMLWRNMDETHPLHDRADPRFAGYLMHLYEEMDGLVGRVLDAADDDTLLMVCSDHGFAQFGREFHLNTWLREKGLLKLKDSAKNKDEASILDIDWAHTYAYALGFNGLYLNLKGRERDGVIERGSSTEKRLLATLRKDLAAVRDDETGFAPVAQIYDRDALYSGPVTPDMPELLVGYRPGYRHSAASVLGETGQSLIELNRWAWSGDHSMAKDLVPGVLFSSQPIATSDPEIVDLPVTILSFFGIGKPREMVGRDLMAPPSVKA